MTNISISCSRLVTENHLHQLLIYADVFQKQVVRIEALLLILKHTLCEATAVEELDSYILEGPQSQTVPSMAMNVKWVLEDAAMS